MSDMNENREHTSQAPVGPRANVVAPAQIPVPIVFAALVLVAFAWLWFFFG